MLYRREKREYRHIGFVVRPETKDWLMRKAEKQRVPLSQWIRETIVSQYKEELIREGLIDEE